MSKPEQCVPTCSENGLGRDGPNQARTGRCEQRSLAAIASGVAARSNVCQVPLYDQMAVDIDKQRRSIGDCPAVSGGQERIGRGERLLFEPPSLLRVERLEVALDPGVPSSTRLIASSPSAGVSPTVLPASGRSRRRTCSP